MVEAPGRVLQGRENVLALEVWVVGEDLLVRFARREELQDVLYPYAHASDAGSPPALIRVDRDTVEEISHDALLAVLVWVVSKSTIGRPTT